MKRSTKPASTRSPGGDHRSPPFVVTGAPDPLARCPPPGRHLKNELGADRQRPGHIGSPGSQLQRDSQPARCTDRIPAGGAPRRAGGRDRDEIADILAGRDDRLLVVVGPCSVHDPAAALEYASRLVKMADELKDQLKIVMRVYFEKPRTTIGWKGLINDPGMDGTYDVARGLRVARQLLLDIIDIGLPVGCGVPRTDQPAVHRRMPSPGEPIGARTTESQVHRQLASGLSMPVGFKNGTDGNIQVAVDGVESRCRRACFLRHGRYGPRRGGEHRR